MRVKVRKPIPMWAKAIWSLSLLGCLAYAVAIALYLPREAAVYVGFVWTATVYIFYAMVVVSCILAIAVRLFRGESLDDDSADSSDVANLIP